MARTKSLEIKIQGDVATVRVWQHAARGGKFLATEYVGTPGTSVAEIIKHADKAGEIPRRQRGQRT